MRSWTRFPLPLARPAVLATLLALEAPHRFAQAAERLRRLGRLGPQAYRVEAAPQQHKRVHMPLELYRNLTRLLGDELHSFLRRDVGPRAAVEGAVDVEGEAIVGHRPAHDLRY